MTNGYWWCAECYEEVDCHRVTSQELHDTCGRPVVWVEPQDPVDLLRAQLAALQSENAEKDREIDRLRLQCPVQVEGDVMALALELAETKAALSRVEAERDHYKRKYEELGAEYTKLRTDRAFRRGAQGEENDGV